MHGRSPFIYQQTAEEVDNIVDREFDELSKADASFEDECSINEAFFSSNNYKRDCSANEGNSENELQTRNKDHLIANTLQSYLNHISHKPLLSPKEEKYFAKQAQQGSFPARQIMIEHNLRLVVSVAKRYINRGLPLPDIIAEGNFGLIHAVEKFQPSQGFRFSTYAIWWIRQSIEQAIYYQSRTIRLPVHVIRNINQILKAKYKIGKENSNKKFANHRNTVVEKIAHSLKKSCKEINYLFILNNQISPVSMDDIDKTSSLINFITDQNDKTLLDGIYQSEIQKLVKNWLNLLSDKHRYVIERRFGLNHVEVKTLEELAKNMNLTRERICQIQQEALSKLKSYSLSNKMLKHSIF